MTIINIHLLCRINAIVHHCFFNAQEPTKNENMDDKYDAIHYWHSLFNNYSSVTRKFKGIEQEQRKDHYFLRTTKLLFNFILDVLVIQVNNKWVLIMFYLVCYVPKDWFRKDLANDLNLY